MIRAAAGRSLSVEIMESSLQFCSRGVVFRGGSWWRETGPGVNWPLLATLLAGLLSWAKLRAMTDTTGAEDRAWEVGPETGEDPLAVALREELGEAIGSARTLGGDLTLQVRREDIAEVCAVLKEGHGFTWLVDLCGVDFPGREPRFEVVYHLHSFAANRRVRLKVATGEATPVPSVTPVWRAAHAPEREVWDLFGVRFEGHPDLTRILLREGFEGHPLRKDFPVDGPGLKDD
jgi:NADH-quinone oxidoreductase subunit C